MDFEEEQNDQFDRLPDALLHLVFNKLCDAQSLSRCILVCKRFASVIPEVDNVSLTVRRKSQTLTRGKQSYDQITKSSSYGDGGHGGPKSLLKSLIRKAITRPLQFLLRVITLKSSSSDDDACCDCSYHSANEVLKNFKEIQFLRMELPGHTGEIGSNGGDSFLRWRAEFGSELQSCVIVGAKSLHKSSQIPNNGEESVQELLLTDDELKMRVVWTISCLIAASARHHLLQQVVSEHRMLRSVVVADGSKQGRLCMRKEQIEELRSNVNSSADLDLSPPLERTPVPALKMKLWYVPVLELPASACVMKGATLLVIRPVDGAKKPESDDDLVERVCNGEEEEDDDDEKVFGEAAREMMKKKKTLRADKVNNFSALLWSSWGREREFTSRRPDIKLEDHI